MAQKFVSYLRVSTDRQGDSGLGLEAQREGVARYAASGEWEQVTEYVEVMSGKRSDRPKLKEAIAAARKYRATLIMAKMDRLGRKASYVLHLLDTAGIDFRFAESPHASQLEIGVRAIVAEEEGRSISQRTKAALAAAKVRGVELGAYAYRMPTEQRLKGHRRGLETRRAQSAAWARSLWADVQSIRNEGVTSLSGIAAALNDRGIPTRRGGNWQAIQVRRLLATLDA